MKVNFQIWSSIILTAVLQESLGQLLLMDEPIQNCDDCIDIPPDNIWTCEQQAGWGKCNRYWMTADNYCAKTCGRCNCNQEAPVSTSAQVIITPRATQQLVLPESARRSSCDCDDIPPYRRASCEQQKTRGRCETSWFKRARADAPNGYCASTCGRCVCESAGEDCSCTDITPSGSPFDCPTQQRFGQCEASWMLSTKEDPNGYCQISCGRCTCRPKEQEEDPCDVLRQHGDGVSIIRVSSIAVSDVATATAASLSSAIAQVQDGSASAVSAAQTSSTAIGLAVADAVASVTISGCTKDAEVNIISSTVSSAVACVLAESLSKAFAKIDNTIVQSIATVKECPQELINQLTGLTTDQQLFTSTTPTPSPTPPSSPFNGGACVDVKPSGGRSCQSVAFKGLCNQVLPGECEKSCGKCQA